MASTRQWVVAVVAFAFGLTLMSGCASGSVQRGALIGAASGAALGVGAGLLMTDPKLLGSTPESKLELERGASVGAGALIGAVFGGIVGAMIGHGRDISDRPPVPTQSSAQAHAPNAF